MHFGAKFWLLTVSALTQASTIVFDRPGGSGRWWHQGGPERLSLGQNRTRGGRSTRRYRAVENGL